jgi:hypothetical protein
MKFIVALSNLALISLSNVAPCFAANQPVSRWSDQFLSSHPSPNVAKSFQSSVAQRTSAIRNDSEAALNAVDLCKKNAEGFLRADKTRLAVITSNCAQLTHTVLAALRGAKYSPQGYNLHNRQDFDKFLQGTVPIIIRNKDFRSPYATLRQFFSSSVLEEILQGSVGAYIWLDYGIDPRKL